jgi:hypothetical protein
MGSEEGPARSRSGRASPQVLLEDAGRLQMLYPGLQITLQRDEAEGYYMNITSPQPKVFVLWRMEDAVAKPQLLTVSYHEGSRWLDSGETVDGVPLPLELLPWMAQFCNEHYKPEPRKKANMRPTRTRGAWATGAPIEIHVHDGRVRTQTR